MKQKLLRPIAGLTAILIWLVSSVYYVVADDLKVALAAEPTSMDPHYQNLTINNSFATQIYNALVLQDVNQNLIPGLATSWKPVDDRTWEFTLRKM
jgi:peptide/nickel transport system substrate-binding protein